MIRHYKQGEIDKARWDKTIDLSKNGRIYAYSWLLDILTENRWEALILNDYEAVFPLPWKKKYGLKYLYQPYFCQQLGLFSTLPITPELIRRFIEAVPAKFVYWNLHLNSGNNNISTGLPVLRRTSYRIHLRQPYTDIYARYSQDARKNIRKTEKTAYSYVKKADTGLIIRAYTAEYGHHHEKAATFMEKIHRCMDKALSLEKGFTRAIYGPDGELWSAAFFFLAHGNIHYALAAPTPEGKKYGITHALIHEVLKEYAEKDLVFDFEGSDIKSVAYFYAKFGAVPEHYLQLCNPGLLKYFPFLVRKALPTG